MLRLTLRAYTVCRPTDSRAQLFPFNGGRTWWARFEFTRINIEPIILKNKIEDLREAGATSLNAAAFSGIANWLAVL